MLLVLCIVQLQYSHFSSKTCAHWCRTIESAVSTIEYWSFDTLANDYFFNKPFSSKSTIGSVIISSVNSIIDVSVISWGTMNSLINTTILSWNSHYTSIDTSLTS
ncbi:unnamed protein product [Moneuplotes crassus]|uniref:Uncharacterized protein n=1 Tax=Euplotes crassus TaxID=5936 RepID=A0AAD1Y3R6_EUPCR|nr:unnamed protein product [Moneuplotes crassus]